MTSKEAHEAAAKELLEKHKDKLPPWCGYNTDNLDEIPVGVGWSIILLNLCRYIDWLAYTYGIKLKVAQVKEKFGGLRFYTNGFDIDPEYLRVNEDGSYTRIKNQGSILKTPDTDFNIMQHVGEAYGAIQLAEYLCDVTCEQCGQPGSRRGGGWISTLCDDCWEPIKKRETEGDEQYQKECEEINGKSS